MFRQLLRAVSLCALSLPMFMHNSSFAESFRELAHSDRLALQYFIEVASMSGDDWCKTELVLQVRADQSRFTPGPDFLNMTQRAGKLLGDECDRTRKVSIVVIDRAAGFKGVPLWAGVATRADGWVPRQEVGCRPSNLDCLQAGGAESSHKVDAGRATGNPPVTPPKNESVLTTRADRDFGGKDISKQDRNSSSLDNANFAGASLGQTDFTNSRIRQANFQNADLRSVRFGGSDLSGSDFRGAIMPFFTGNGLKLRDVNMEGLDLKGVDFYRVDLRGSNLRNTKNFGSVMGADLSGVDLRGANLLTARTGFARGDLSGAKLKGAIYDADTAFPSGFSPKAAGMIERELPVNLSPIQAQSGAAVPGNATASNTPQKKKQGKSFAGKQLPERYDFSNEDLRNANFEGADLNSARFTGAALQSANFRSADLRGVSFRGADLTGADFTGAKVDLSNKPVWVNAKLVGAKLPNLEFLLVGCKGYYSAAHYDLASQRILAAITDFNNGSLTFRNANLTNSRLCGDMTGVDFRGADLRGADLSQATEMQKALLGSALYDAGTKINVDPGQFRMVRAPDLVAPATAAGAPVGSDSSQFVGEWWIDKVRPGQSETPFLGYLGLTSQGQFEWSPGDENAKLIFGQWVAIDNGILLKGGENAKDWLVSLIRRDDDSGMGLRLQTEGGKFTRTAFRKVDQKK